SEKQLKKDCTKYNNKKSQGSVKNEDHVSSSGADGYDNADVIMAMSIKELLDWIMDSGSSYYITYKRDYLVDFKEYDGGNILLGDDRECRVRGTVIRKTLKGRKQLGEYQTGWKIKTGNVLDFCNQRNMGFNESGEYKKTFIGSGVGTGSMQVLHGFEFKVEQLGSYI
ncbi:hypothetical protein Tco_0573708, partial [Tanacetum coccineum]